MRLRLSEFGGEMDVTVTLRVAAAPGRYRWRLLAVCRSINASSRPPRRQLSPALCASNAFLHFTRDGKGSAMPSASIVGGKAEARKVESRARCAVYRRIHGRYGHDVLGLAAGHDSGSAWSCCAAS
jgi:hypothetical protein